MRASATSVTMRRDSGKRKSEEKESWERNWN